MSNDKTGAELPEVPGLSASGVPNGDGSKARPRGGVLWGDVPRCPTCKRPSEDCAAESGGIGFGCSLA